MVRKNWGFYLGISERVIIFYVAVWTLMNRRLYYIQEKGLVLRQTVFIFLILILPYLAEKRGIPFQRFPFKLDAIVLSPLFLDTIGNFSTASILSYDRWDFFDNISHFWSSGIFTFLMFTIFVSYLYPKNIEIETKRVFKASLMSGVFIEILWEIWEYYSDFTQGTVLVGGWTDTAGDIFLSFLGSLTAASLYSLWYIKSKEEIRDKYLFNFSQLINGKKRKEIKMPS